MSLTISLTEIRFYNSIEKPQMMDKVLYLYSDDCKANEALILKFKDHFIWEDIVNVAKLHTNYLSAEFKEKFCL